MVRFQCKIDNAVAREANFASAAACCAKRIISPSLPAVAAFAALTMCTVYLDPDAARLAISPLLVSLITALVTLLLFWHLRRFERLLSGGGAPHLAEESFRYAWQSIILVLCTLFSYMILPIPISPFSIPASPAFTSIATSAAAIAAASVATTPLLFPLLLLWFVVRGSARLQEEQRPSLIKTNQPGFALRSLLLALIFILSCSMLMMKPTAAVAIVSQDIAAVAVVAVFIIISLWLALSSNPPTAPAPAETAEAA